jgi:hypothetical protein
MASVGGRSQVSFYGHGKSGANVNVNLTTDGLGNQPPPVNGKLNIEVFTVAAGPVAPGYDGAVLITGAVLIDNNTVSNVGQQNVTETLLSGSFTLVDETGNEVIVIEGSASGGDSMTVVGSSGDTIIGSTIAGTSQLIDVSNEHKNSIEGSETVIGGAGPTTVLAGLGDSIVGGDGGMLIVGGSDDTIIGGSGAITIQGGVGDSIVAGSGGIISVQGHGGTGHGHGHEHGHDGDTISGTEGLTFLEPQQGASTVMGFDIDFDSIQSAASVDATGTFLGSSTSSSSGTTLTFVDGSTMFLAGVTEVDDITFTR